MAHHSRRVIDGGDSLIREIQILAQALTTTPNPVCNEKVHSNFRYRRHAADFRLRDRFHHVTDDDNEFR
ncbi:hypothetical protein [Paraburkholderia gardini]|uniref:hypothetical protein n=1 Tax=Paraburkholderia gardini TaxID=2823469 RepID=UPI001E2A74E6|nr:hypothetical protein [Paraburkholderia gardini]